MAYVVRRENYWAHGYQMITQVVKLNLTTNAAGTKRPRMFSSVFPALCDSGELSPASITKSNYIAITAYMEFLAKKIGTKID